MTLESNPARSWAKRCAYLALALTAAGIASPTDLTHFHLGPLYALEIILLVWFGAVLVARTGAPFKRHRTLWPAAAFFIWGAVLLANDLMAHRESIPDPLTMKRVWQHSVLFIYPAIWMSVGLWLAST